MGRFYANKMTPVTTHQAIEYFQQSVRKDPKYARAYAGLADGYNLALLFQNLPGERASQEARSAARQALSLDESISEAHVSLARTLMWADFNWLSAEQELQRAIELDPQYAEAYQVYAWNLVYRGRYAEALETIQKAVNLEPNSARIRTVMAMILIKARQFDRAVRVSREAVQIDPGYARGYEALGRAALLNGDAEGAIQAISRAVELNANGEPKARLGWAYGSLGRRQDALRILRELSRGGSQANSASRPSIPRSANATRLSAASKKRGRTTPSWANWAIRIGTICAATRAMNRSWPGSISRRFNSRCEILPAKARTLVSRRSRWFQASGSAPRRVSELLKSGKMRAPPAC